MLRRSILSVALAFLSATALHAEELRLSLHQAIDMALRQGTEAQLARSDEERARIARREGLLALLPQADAKVTRSSQSINLATFGFSLPGQPSVVGPFNVSDAQIAAAMQLLNLAALKRYRALEQGERASRFDSAAVDNEVAAAVSRLYVLIQRADAQVESRRADVDLFRKLARVAEDEFNAGTGTKLEIAQQNLQLARAQQGVLVAENDRRNAALALLGAIGADESKDVVVTDPLPSAAPPPDAAAALELARRTRPELEAAHLHEEEARLNVRAQQWRRLPSLSADMEGDYSGNHVDDLRWTRRIAAGLSLPLFRGEIETGIARATIDLHDATIRREQRERQVDEEVRRAVLAVENANARIGVSQEAVRVAEEALTIARDRSGAGYGSAVEVDRAEDAYRQTREELITAQADAAAAQFELQRATGTIASLRGEGP